MAFHTLRRRYGTGRASIENRVAAHRGVNNITHFCLSGDVAREAGLAKGSSAQLLEGSGDDAGMIGMRPGNGKNARRVHGAGRQMVVAAVVDGIRAPAKTTSIPHTFRDGMLIIDTRPLR